MKNKVLLYLMLFFIITTLSSCDNRKVKHSGFEDLVIGSYSIILYENGEFKFESGLGYHEGKYKISNDTVYLTYSEKTDRMPNKLIISDSCFYIIDTSNFKGANKITRTK